MHEIDSFVMWKLESIALPNDAVFTWRTAAAVAHEAHAPITDSDMEALEEYHKTHTA